MFREKGEDPRESPMNFTVKKVESALRESRKRDEKVTSLRLVRKILNAILISTMKFLLGCRQHFISAYVPPPRANHFIQSTVMPNSFFTYISFSQRAEIIAVI